LEGLPFGSEQISQIILGLSAFYVLIQFIASVRLVPTKKAFIVERLGKYHSTLKPGFHLLIPFIDKVTFKQDLKEEAITVQPQECFTRDNVKVIVDGVIYISVIDPINASYGVTDYQFAAIQLAQTTTRSVIGKLELDRTFEERDLINAQVVSTLNEVGGAWGIQVHRYEVKNITPPETVKKAMEKQMTAERDKRALIAESEGKKQAKINDSEGKMQEIINVSEGAMQQMMNEAEGKAHAILAIAAATAESIEKIAEAITASNGQEALNMKLAQQYMTQLSKLAKEDTEIILPTDLTNFNELLKSLDITSV